MSTYAANRRFRLRRLAFVNWLKELPCEDCGSRFPPECMDFDHIRGDKKFQIGRSHSEYTLAALQAEIEKCALVCANCHRIRTKKRLHA